MTTTTTAQAAYEAARREFVRKTIDEITLHAKVLLAMDFESKLDPHNLWMAVAQIEQVFGIQGSLAEYLEDCEPTFIRSPDELIAEACGKQPAPATGKAPRVKKASVSNLAERFLAYVEKNPGQRAEEVAKGLGAKKLPMPAIRKLLGKDLRTKGARRGTRYWAR